MSTCRCGSRAPLRWKRLLLVAVAVALSAPARVVAQGEPLKDLQVVRLTNGTNAVDLDGDKRPDLVVVGWRENSNAHGYDLVTFYLDKPAQEHLLSLIVFSDSTGMQTDESFRTTNGADCILEDMRLLQPQTGPDLLVIGRRPLGESFVDSAIVTFTVYELVIDDEGVPGVPPYQFQAKRTIRSKAKYCDVNEAFRAELGLGEYR